MARGLGKLTAAAVGGVVAAMALSVAVVSGDRTTAVVQLPAENAAERQRLEEAEMLARARAEREAWTSSGQVPGLDSGDAVRQEAVDVEAMKRLREAERDAELDQISARIRARASQLPLPPVAADLPSPHAPGRGLERATVLLVIEPGHTGIRRLNPSADPILCLGEVCYISQGAGVDAVALPRRRALGVLNTLGPRAGACNDRTSCVFRNIAIDGSADVVQPVDLRLLRHDRREARPVRVDTTCRAAASGLSCMAPETGTDYRLWVVPEVVARQAGPRALDTAVTLIDPPTPLR